MIVNTDDELIYYVCYGSNLLEERLESYFTGRGLEKYGIKEREESPFAEEDLLFRKKNEVVLLPYSLYFAKNSSRWDQGGVAFIDQSVKLEDDKKEKWTIGRAYLMSEAQYDYLREQEGDIWYAKDVRLPSVHGIKALAFTNSSPQRNRRNVPSKRYLEVIEDGLMECGLNKEEAEEYLKRRTGN